MGMKMAVVQMLTYIRVFHSSRAQWYARTNEECSLNSCVDVFSTVPTITNSNLYDETLVRYPINGINSKAIGRM